MKRTRSVNKVNVTFDYETGSFVPVEDGEFVVITSTHPAIVLPRAARFAAKRDFYEFYQDYYHCPDPDAGEVKIVEPAALSPAGAGWTLETSGVLEVVRDQPKKKIVPPPPVQPTLAQPPIKKREEAEPVVAAAPKEQPAARACPGCGSLIEAKYSFCWKCGNALEFREQSVKLEAAKTRNDHQLSDHRRS